MEQRVTWFWAIVFTYFHFITTRLRLVSIKKKTFQKNACAQYCSEPNSNRINSLLPVLPLVYYLALSILFFVVFSTKKRNRNSITNQFHRYGVPSCLEKMCFFSSLRKKKKNSKSMRIEKLAVKQTQNPSSVNPEKQFNITVTTRIHKI